MSNNKSKDNNGIIKILRFFTVFAGWIFISTTSYNSDVLFRSTIIYVLGLVYDYLNIWFSGDEGSYQKKHAVVTLATLGFFLLISILGMTHVFLEDPAKPGYVKIVDGSLIFPTLSFAKSTFCYFLSIVLVLVFFEYGIPFKRKNMSSMTS